MAPLWLTIRKAKRLVREAALQRCPDARLFFRSGATDVSPRHVVFLIATKTDAQAQMLREDTSFLPALRDALTGAGYPPEAIPHIHFPVDSQERVDREHNGNWSEAIELPH